MNCLNEQYSRLPSKLGLCTHLAAHCRPSARPLLAHSHHTPWPLAGGALTFQPLLTPSRSRPCSEPACPGSLLQQPGLAGPSWPGDGAEPTRQGPQVGRLGSEPALHHRPTVWSCSLRKAGGNNIGRGFLLGPECGCELEGRWVLGPLWCRGPLPRSPLGWHPASRADAERLPPGMRPPLSAPHCWHLLCGVSVILLPTRNRSSEQGRHMSVLSPVGYCIMVQVGTWGLVSRDLPGASRGGSARPLGYPPCALLGLL